jgi:hypothetical protein
MFNKSVLRISLMSQGLRTVVNSNTSHTYWDMIRNVKKILKLTRKCTAKKSLKSNYHLFFFWNCQIVIPIRILQYKFSPIGEHSSTVKIRRKWASVHRRVGVKGLSESLETLTNTLPNCSMPGSVVASRFLISSVQFPVYPLHALTNRNLILIFSLFLSDWETLVL